MYWGKMRKLIALYIISLLPVIAYATEVTLTWSAPTTNADGTPLTDLAGYKIYYGTESGNYSNIVDVGYLDGAEVSYSLELTDNRYYFAVTAYDTSGNESDYSNERAKTVGTDTDGDNIPDLVDNCRLTLNSGQQDTDNDGYGNMCDADLDNDGFVGIFDFNIFKSAWLSDMGGENYNPSADFDSDGDVDYADFYIFKTRWNTSAPWE